MHLLRTFHNRRRGPNTSKLLKSSNLNPKLRLKFRAQKRESNLKVIKEVDHSEADENIAPPLLSNGSDDSEISEYYSLYASDTFDITTVGQPSISKSISANDSGDEHSFELPSNVLNTILDVNWDEISSAPVDFDDSSKDDRLVPLNEVKGKKIMSRDIQSLLSISSEEDAVYYCRASSESTSFDDLYHDKLLNKEDSFSNDNSIQKERHTLYAKTEEEILGDSDNFVSQAKNDSTPNSFTQLSNNSELRAPSFEVEDNAFLTGNQVLTNPGSRPQDLKATSQSKIATTSSKIGIKPSRIQNGFHQLHCIRSKLSGERSRKKSRTFDSAKALKSKEECYPDISEFPLLMESHRIAINKDETSTAVASNLIPSALFSEGQNPTRPRTYRESDELTLRSANDSMDNSNSLYNLDNVLLIPEDLPDASSVRTPPLTCVLNPSEESPERTQLTELGTEVKTFLQETSDPFCPALTPVQNINNAWAKGNNVNAFGNFLDNASTQVESNDMSSLDIVQHRSDYDIISDDIEIFPTEFQSNAFSAFTPVHCSSPQTQDSLSTQSSNGTPTDFKLKSDNVTEEVTASDLDAGLDSKSPPTRSISTQTPTHLDEKDSDTKTKAHELSNFSSSLPSQMDSILFTCTGSSAPKLEGSEIEALSNQAMRQRPIRTSLRCFSSGASPRSLQVSAVTPQNFLSKKLRVPEKNRLKNTRNTGSGTNWGGKCSNQLDVVKHKNNGTSDIPACSSSLEVTLLSSEKNGILEPQGYHDNKSKADEKCYTLPYVKNKFRASSCSSSSRMELPLGDEDTVRGTTEPHKWFSPNKNPPITSNSPKALQFWAMAQERAARENDL